MLINQLRIAHGKTHEWRLRWQSFFKLKKKIQTSDKNTLLFLMTPVHGNIGDQAIAKATADFLSGMKQQYIEVTTVDLRMFEKIHSLSSLNGRKLLIHGGGYFGTLWPELDDLFRRILMKTPDSNILCFPNTIFYDDTPEGKNRFMESVKIINSHKRLKICARERISYELVSGQYRDVVLMPDIVLYLDESKKQRTRNGCLFCFRNDKEKTLKPEEFNAYKREAGFIFPGNVRITDIDGLDYIPVTKRNEAIQKKLDEFKASELVITDRLHGMIFSAITGTPCIVMNSKSHKIKGSFEWIKHLEYIVLAEKGDSIVQLYDTIPKKQFYFDNENLQPYYEELKKYVFELTEY